MGSLRENESEQFPMPFSPHAYGVLTTLEEGKLKCSFYSSKGDTLLLFNLCRELTKSNKPFIVYGVWHGQFDSDIFILDWRVLSSRCKSSNITLYGKVVE